MGVSYFKGLTGDHGVVLSLKGTKPAGFTIYPHNLSLQLYGNVWDAVPAGLDSIIKWSYMPLNLGSYIHNQVCQSGSTNWSMDLHLGTKENGTFGMKHTTVDERVQEQAGKTVFIELSFVDNTLKNAELFDVVTTVNDIKQALDRKGARHNIIYDGQIPYVRTVKRIPDWMRWFLFPTLFTLSMWILFLSPATLLDHLPQVLPENNASVSGILPPHPKNLQQSFQLGQLQNRLALAEAASVPNSTLINTILQEAATVVGRFHPLVSAELHLVEKIVNELDNSEGTIQRISGFFSFINIMWLLAILGITFSIGPVIYVFIIKPIAKIVQELVIWTIRNVILPLHNWGFFEALAYLVCLLFVTEGCRHPSDRGFFISLTGLCLFIVAFAYSTFLHAKEKRGGRQLSQIASTWFLLSALPIAIQYQSSLLGWLVIISFYQIVGFSVICGGLCYCIGFRDKSDMKRVVGTSTIILLIFTALRIAKANSRFLLPFATAANTLGTFTLLLALLIYSSEFFPSTNVAYVKRQIPMIFALTVLILFGNMYGVNAVANTGTSFLVLFCVEKYLDLHAHRKWNGWLLMLLGSFFTYYAALYLHSHPQFVAALFASW